jgi:hypothetical protein
MACLVLHKNTCSHGSTVTQVSFESSTLKQMIENIFYFDAPDHKMSGALCHGLCVGVRKHLVSINYRTNAWVDSPDIFVAYWRWLEEGPFLMTSSATHPRWSLWPPSWICFLSITGQMPGSMPGLIHTIFMRLIEGDWRKVPFDDQLCRSSKMAAMAIILDLVSVY